MKDSFQGILWGRFFLEYFCEGFFLGYFCGRLFLGYFYEGYFLGYFCERLFLGYFCGGFFLRVFLWKIPFRVFLWRLSLGYFLVVSFFLVYLLWNILHFLGEGSGFFLVFFFGGFIWKLWFCFCFFSCVFCFVNNFCWSCLKLTLFLFFPFKNEFQPIKSLTHL